MQFIFNLICTIILYFILLKKQYEQTLAKMRKNERLSSAQVEIITKHHQITEQRQKKLEKKFKKLEIENVAIT